MARLPVGMYRRGSAYYIRTRIDGRLVKRSLGANFREAMRQYRLLQARGGPKTAFRTGELPGKVTVETIGRQWLAQYVANNRNVKGQRLAEARFDRYINPAIGRRKIASIKAEDLRALRVSLEKSQLSLQTVSHILADVRCLFRYAADELAIIPRSPVPPRLLPRLQERQPRPHSLDELEAVLSAAPPDYAFVIRLDLMTGLRWAEVRRLRWADVDWTGPQLLISKTKSRKVRRVPVIPALEDLLRARPPGTPGAYVSPFRAAESTMFNYHVRRLTGCAAFSFHRLRHTFACSYLAAGGSLKALQLILGHSTIKVTEQYATLDDKYILQEARSIPVSIPVSIPPPDLRLLRGRKEGS